MTDSPSEICKKTGLDSLAELVRITGQSERTLIRWHKTKPKLFIIVVLGAVASKK